MLLGGLLACEGSTPPEAPPLPPLPAPRQVDLGGPAAGEVRPHRAFTLALSGEVRGEIEPCGCPTLPFGGFPRRARLLQRLDAGGPLLQVDVGELLVKGASLLRDDQRERAQLVLSLSQQVGVLAWVPGPSDPLALPVEELLALARAGKAPPPISATWTDAQGRALLPPSLVVEREGRRIGLVGLSSAPSDPVLAAAIHTLDPVPAARAALAALPADLDLVLALGSVDDADADRVAREVEGLAGLLTTSGESYQDPRIVQGVPIVEAPPRGRYLQVLQVELGSDARQPMELRPDDSDWRTLLTLRQQASRGLPAPDLPAAEAELAALLDQGRNLLFVDSRPLGVDLDRESEGDPAGQAGVVSSIEAFKREVLHEAARRAATPPPPQQAAYATAAACTTCHLDEFARWSFSAHSQSAWQSLVARQATGDAECLPCHTTGFGEPGGLGEPDTSSLRRFKSVQCEACHGPMGRHPDDPKVKALPMGPERCTGCHDPANSPGFDYSSYLPRASCQGGAPEMRPL